MYTNDQLHVCGSPTFNGAPVSLLSGAPDDPYVYDVPGSVAVTTGSTTSYYPEGYTTDQVGCGGGANPTLAHGAENRPATEPSEPQLLPCRVRDTWDIGGGPARLRQDPRWVAPTPGPR